MKYLLALLLCARCAFGASILLQGGVTTRVASAAPYYSFDDAQLLYYWTFDGPDVAWQNSGGYVMAAKVGSSANIVASAMNSGSFLTVMNNEMRPGVAGQSQLFQGVGNLRITNLNLSAVSLMTISVWIKPTYVLAWNGDKMFIEGGLVDSSTQTNAVIIDTGQGNRDFNLIIRDKANPALFLQKTAKNTNMFPVSNVWYHMACVFNNTTVAGDAKVFINTTNTTMTTATTTKSAAGNFGNHYWGMFGRGNGSLPLPNCQVDEFRIYTNELTAAQLSEIYTNTARRINAP